jgi:PAS domain S-box-containing protein
VLVALFAGVAAAALWRAQDDHTEIARWLVVGLGALAFLMAAGLVALVASVVRPLAALRSSARAIASGDLEARASVSGPEEVAFLARDISKRKRAEESVRRAEERYRRLFEDAPVMYVITRNQDGLPIIADCNELLLSTLGYTRAEVLGRPLDDFYAPESRAELLEGGGYQRALDGRFIAEERYLVASDGRIIQTLLRALPETDPDGQVFGTRAMYVDISERRRAEQGLRESEEKYRKVVQDSIDGIVITQGLQMAFVNPALLKMFGCEREEEMVGRPFTEFISPEYRELLVERGYARERGQAEPERYGYKALRKDGSEFDAEISVTRIIYQGKPARQGIVRDISERKRAEQALRESEEQYRLLAENATDVIWTMDTNLRLTYVSPSIMTLRGFSAEEVMAQTLEEMFTPASLKVAKKAIAAEQAIEGSEGKDLTRSPTVELEQRCKDDSTVWTEVKFVILRDSDGQPIGTLGVTRDVSERKRAEEALRESEEQYRAVFEQAIDSILLIDAQTGALVEFNDKAHQALGYTREEFEKLRIPDYEAIESPEEVANHLKKIVEEGADIFETKHRTKGGEIRDVEVRTRAISIRGRDFIQAIFHDISERKRAEEALRESEERFRGLAEATFEGIVIHDRGRILDANQVFANMFGYGLSEIIGVHVLDLAAPESRDLASQRIVSKSKEPFELIALRKDGSTFPSEVCGGVLRYRGRVVTVAAIRDVSERKQAEEALQRAREEIESRVERRVPQVNGYGLTFRELTVLHLVAAGESDKEAAAVLGISPLTAHKHIANILEKMAASCRTEAAVRAIREGLLD